MAVVVDTLPVIWAALVVLAWRAAAIAADMLASITATATDMAARPGKSLKVYADRDTKSPLSATRTEPPRSSLSAPRQRPSPRLHYMPKRHTHRFSGQPCFTCTGPAARPQAASASAPVATCAHAAHHFGLLAPRPLVAAAELLKPPRVLALPPTPAELIHVDRGQGRHVRRRRRL